MFEENRDGPSRRDFCSSNMAKPNMVASVNEAADNTASHSPIAHFPTPSQTPSQSETKVYGI
jgi:hypothetical protein